MPKVRNQSRAELLDLVEKLRQRIRDLDEQNRMLQRVILDQEERKRC